MGCRFMSVGDAFPKIIYNKLFFNYWQDSHKNFSCGSSATFTSGVTIAGTGSCILIGDSSGITTSAGASVVTSFGAILSPILSLSAAKPLFPSACDLLTTVVDCSALWRGFI